MYNVSLLQFLGSVLSDLCLSVGKCTERWSQHRSMVQTQEKIISQPCKWFKGHHCVEEALYLQHKISKVPSQRNSRWIRCEVTIEGVRGGRERSVGRSGSKKAMNCLCSEDRERSINNLQGRWPRRSMQVAYAKAMIYLGCQDISKFIREFPAESVPWSHAETPSKSYCSVQWSITLTP